VSRRGEETKEMGAGGGRVKITGKEKEEKDSEG
jgi:hypothetical protein